MEYTLSSTGVGRVAAEEIDTQCGRTQFQHD